MKVGFVGAGKVGFSLGKFFSEGGIQVTGYYSRHRESAAEAARFTSSKCYDTLKALIEESDAVFLTVPDGAITKVYQEVGQYHLSDKQICHCSGAMTAGEAFPGIARTGAYGYSIHPLFPISSKYETYRELTGAFFCLEGAGPHLTLWQRLLEGLGARTRIIQSKVKKTYHAACAISSNLVCALVYESMELFSSCGFTSEEALAALGPLIRNNTRHIITDGPVAALTGPIERGDGKTVAEHLAVMPTMADRELYRQLSRKALEAAIRRHPERDYREMIQILGGYNGEEYSSDTKSNEGKGRKNLPAYLL